MLIQLYDWASSVWNMLLSLEEVFSTGLIDLMESAPSWVRLLFSVPFELLLSILKATNLNPSIFSLIFSSVGVTTLLVIGIVLWLIP